MNDEDIKKLQNDLNKLKTEVKENTLLVNQFLFKNKTLEDKIQSFEIKINKLKSHQNG